MLKLLSEGESFGSAFRAAEHEGFATRLPDWPDEVFVALAKYADGSEFVRKTDTLVEVAWEPEGYELRRNDWEIWIEENVNNGHYYI